jgi:hypothetical protein
MRRWLSGSIIRSSVDTWYHDGLVRHAGSDASAANVTPSGAFCVTAMTSASSSGRSWQKLSWNRSCAIRR